MRKREIENKREIEKERERDFFFILEGGDVFVLLYEMIYDLF